MPTNFLATLVGVNMNNLNLSLGNLPIATLAIMFRLLLFTLGKFLVIIEAIFFQNNNYLFG